MICFACPKKALTQTHSIDSMKHVLQQSTEDSVRVFAFIQLASQSFNYDSLKALHYLNEGYVIVKKIKWYYATGEYYNNKAIIKQYESDNDAADLLFDTAIVYYEKAINAKRNEKEVSDAKLSIATCKGQKGDILLAQEKTKEAITAYIEALEAWKASEDPQKQIAIATYYSKISTVYYKLNQFDKALEYDKLSASIFMQGTNEEGQAWSLIYVCDDFNELNQLDSSLVYLTKAMPIVKKLNTLRLNIQYYNKLGHISFLKNDYKGSIGFYEKTISEARKEKGLYQEASAKKMIGICYSKLGEYVTARKYLLLALSITELNNYVKEKMEILHELVNVEEKTNNKSQAFVYLKQLISLKDSVNIVASKNEIAEIENKYHAAEKEKEIIQLQTDKQIQTLSIKEKSTLNYFLITLLGILLITAFVGFRNFRHRQLLAKQQHELQQQQIRELEKDKQLVAVDSMLKGQEDERTRLAKDLHDGLGGMLSGVKFSLMNMKSNLIISHENVIVFERSLDMLDTSIQELRRVAHNMMPEALVKFGLDEALKDYCDNINKAQILNVKYQSYGMENRFESTSEIIIYRIIQELLNNIFKHAVANEVLVQLIREENRISITVEDNGKGFDIKILEKSKNSGWANIQSRVNYLKGKLDIVSEENKGTSVNIEVYV
jgi:signal transduction histidine kinase